MNDFLAPALSATGIVGLFGAVGVLIVQMFRQNTALGKERDGQIKDLKSDIAALKVENTAHQAENFACRLQVNELCDVLRQNGLSIPDWLFRNGERRDP